MEEKTPASGNARGISGITLGHLAVAILCLSVLISPLGFFLYIKYYGLFSSCTQLFECQNLDEFRKYVSATWGGLISLATTAGCLGTVVSFFLRQTHKDYINTGVVIINKNIPFIGIREVLILSFFGSVFGLIMLALFIGGFLKGNLFPEISGGSWIDLGIRINSWAKVFIWCFLAGFSERLIPNLLDSLVRRVSSADDKENK